MDKYRFLGGMRKELKSKSKVYKGEKKKRIVKTS